MNAFATCSMKIGYATKVEAKVSQAKKFHKYGAHRGKRKHLYLCPLCGRYHTGRRR